eukprot:CAMPEP_0113580870 /NCGR_PEP_ID=MMETSP0015_2-20120614/30938_1 /TAXON_ID=2838 /ORGANISM="Odontella" /LENGTH=609 /DNA_ID=CAMNT_0000485157 /DNA_START=14 /DNA_END=1843 /DNA_ORIENTATION=- /assembly_acc=CAM_ASM_000160
MRSHRFLLLTSTASVFAVVSAAFGGGGGGGAWTRTAVGVTAARRELADGVRRIVPVQRLAASVVVEEEEDLVDDGPAADGAASTEAVTRLRAFDPHPDADDLRAPSTPSLLAAQAEASIISSSFEPRPFDPPPLLTNEHLQTIGGAFLRKRPECAYVTGEGPGGAFAAWEAVRGLADGGSRPDETRCEFWDERERISDKSGDYFHVDYKYVSGKGNEDAEEADEKEQIDDRGNRSWKAPRRRGRPSPESRGMVLLLHGLESNSNSSLSTDIASVYIRRGFDVACLNFRGCCGDDGDRTQLGGYHLGFTDDVKLLLAMHTDRWRSGTLKEEDPPVFISGFSLGANVALKALGELGEDARKLYGVRGAAVCGAPFDNELNNKKIEAPGTFNKLVYSKNFLVSMKGRLKEQIDDLCLVMDDDEGDDDEEGDGGNNGRGVDLNRCMSAESIAEMECELIAPLYGFADNVDYYRKTTFIINAEDDPFFDPVCWPIEKSSEGGGAAPLKMVRTDHGGHLGFMFHRPSDIERMEGAALAGRESWMPTELGRFLDHVACADEAAEVRRRRPTRSAARGASFPPRLSRAAKAEAKAEADQRVQYFLQTSGFRAEGDRD